MRQTAVLLARPWDRRTADLRVQAVRVVDQRELGNAAWFDLPVGDRLAVGAPAEPVAQAQFLLVDPIERAVDDVRLVGRGQCVDLAADADLRRRCCSRARRPRGGRRARTWRTSAWTVGARRRAGATRGCRGRAPSSRRGCFAARRAWRWCRSAPRDRSWKRRSLRSSAGSSDPAGPTMSAETRTSASPDPASCSTISLSAAGLSVFQRVVAGAVVQPVRRERGGDRSPSESKIRRRVSCGRIGLAGSAMTVSGTRRWSSGATTMRVQSSQFVSSCILV